MSDESSKFKPADNADIHGEVVIAQSISGFVKQKKAVPIRDIDERIVAAARLVN